MKEAGQSPRDPRLPIGGKPRSNSGQGGGMRRPSGAKVSSTERVSLTKPVAINTGGRLERDVLIQGA